jgi:hypothetical protein
MSRNTQIPALSLVPFLLFAGLLLAPPSEADTSDPWAQQFVIPGAYVLWSNGATFRECFAIGNYKRWHSCGDTKSALSDEYVTQRVNATQELTVPTPGKGYLVLEAHIDADAWLYQHVKPFQQRFDPDDGRWVGANIKVFSALYKGQNLIYDYRDAQKIGRGEPPVVYRQGTDGEPVIEPPCLCWSRGATGSP